MASSSDHPKSLEDEVHRLMVHAANRDPIILSAKTGLGTPSVDAEAQIELIYSILGGMQEAILRIAREVDEMKAT